MSMPTFPKNDPPLSREGSLNEIIASIAAEELSLSHILNTQGENLQYVLGTLPGLDEAASQDEVLRINQSVKDTLPGVFISKQPDKAYGGLVTSIQANGVREPVILRLREDGEYQLVTGYRRYRASELAKRQDIPALVYEMTPQEAVNYRRQVQSKPDFPVPGKLVEPSVLDSKPQKPDIKGTENPTAGPQEMDKPKEAPTPATPAKDGKAQDTGTKAAETPTAPAAGDKPKEAQAPADPAKDGKALDTGTKAAETPAAPTAGDKPKETPTAVPGHVARGPAGTAISQIFDERLTPPDEKAKHDIPSPRDDDSFFILLHPAYLQKSKYNTVSVDQQSEDYRELKKSIELNGVKDPVLARNGDEGTLEILSGQRRHMIATELNYPVPTIIQKISDADAKILVADGNLHRPHISAYDLSRSLRMKMEGMKQKSGRRKKGTFKAEELDSDVKLAEIEKLLNWIDVFTWYVNVNARTWAELEADFQAWSDMDGLTWVQVQVREMVIEDLVASWNVFDPRYPRGVRL